MTANSQTKPVCDVSSSVGVENVCGFGLLAWYPKTSTFNAINSTVSTGKRRVGLSSLSGSTASERYVVSRCARRAACV